MFLSYEPRGWDGPSAGHKLIEHEGSVFLVGGRFKGGAGPGKLALLKMVGAGGGDNARHVITRYVTQETRV